MNSRSRTALVLVRPLADIAAFLVVLHAGWAYGLAHVFSFALGWLAVLLIQALVRQPGDRDHCSISARVVVNLLALLLRGGVLALLIGRWQLGASVSIAAAVLASTLVIERGKKLCAALPAVGAERGPQWHSMVLALGAFSVLLRLAYLASVELFPEEAYYWSYAQHMDFGYLDHPPMVAWLIGAGTAVLGNGEFGVRLGALLCAAVASFFVYRSAQELYGRPTALLALVLMQLLPAYFLAGMFLTPDTPLIAAWAAALYFLQRVLLGGHARAWWGAGIALGIGMVCKYTIALLVPATLVFFLMDRPSRAWLRRALPYAAALLALLIFSPVIVWNARHDWASFAFQTSQRLAEAPHFSLHQLVLSALALLTPVGFAALPYLLRAPDGSVDAGSADARIRRLRFLRAYTLVPLVVFVLFSLRHPIKLDWTGGVWVAIVPALAHAIAAPAAFALPQWLRHSWGVTAAVMLLAYGATLHYLTLGLPGVPYSRQMLALPVAWADLAAQVDAIAAQMRTDEGTAPLVVGMNRYMLASELAFYSPDPVRAVRNTTSQHLFGPSGLMYEQWFPNAQQQGRTLLLVALDKAELNAPRLRPYVGALGEVHAGVISHNGRAVSAFYYRAASNYRPPQP